MEEEDRGSGCAWVSLPDTPIGLRIGLEMISSANQIPDLDRGLASTQLSPIDLTSPNHGTAVECRCLSAFVAQQTLPNFQDWVTHRWI